MIQKVIKRRILIVLKSSFFKVPLFAMGGGDFSGPPLLSWHFHCGEARGVVVIPFSYVMQFSDNIIVHIDEPALNQFDMIYGGIIF